MRYETNAAASFSFLAGVIFTIGVFSLVGHFEKEQTMTDEEYAQAVDASLDTIRVTAPEDRAFREETPRITQIAGVGSELYGLDSEGRTWILLRDIERGGRYWQRIGASFRD